MSKRSGPHILSKHETNISELTCRGLHTVLERRLKLSLSGKGSVNFKKSQNPSVVAIDRSGKSRQSCSVNERFLLHLDRKHGVTWTRYRTVNCVVIITHPCFSSVKGSFIPRRRAYRAERSRKRGFISYLCVRGMLCTFSESLCHLHSIALLSTIIQMCAIYKPGRVGMTLGRLV